MAGNKKPDKDHAKGNDAFNDYQRIKKNYLALCRRYGLNPFDLDILSVGLSRLPRSDKCELVRMIVKLVRLERALKGSIGKGLFPLTVHEIERSGYLVPSHH